MEDSTADSAADGAEAAELHDPLTGVLAGIQRLIRRRLRRGQTGPPLRGAAADLLRLAAARPGIRVSEAARELYLAGNSVSTLAGKLSQDGYLVRASDPADRRSALLYATPEARTRIRERDARRSALMHEQLARLSEQDRAALAAALPALRRLAENLRTDVEGT
ncbi:MarR family transcriptional regulator [Streptomyces sp. 8L]|uniref:MarR family transcriptional regulator n=1 Tax=Streptomyces sp. 8L TaxID=2877242 RepID=UPI001CD6E4A2|nr:MarR family transcriptional regulator [Streptomyces sp. 8L]MCA1217987.1 MarR family transcriptional regulator [Streptomyces sp. 8L]